MNTKISDAQKILREMDAGAVQLLEGWTHAVPVAFCKDGVLFWHGDHAAHRGENYDLFTHPQPAALNEVPTMDDAIAAGDGTLHGAIDHWQDRALKAEAALNKVSGNSGELGGDERARFSEWWSSQPQDVGSLLPYELARSAWQAALAATGKQQGGDHDVVRAVAKATWPIRREYEDKCDFELEDIPVTHPVWDEARAACAAIQPFLHASFEQQVGEVQGDTLAMVRANLRSISDLAARQPVGQEPLRHACTNCDRTDATAVCQNCAGLAWDAGRLQEFHEIHDLGTSLGEGALDGLVPEEWHDKPLLRFQGAYDCGDDSAGIPARSGYVLAPDQSGTVLGDYLATLKPDGADALCEADVAREMRDKGFMWVGDRWVTDWREL